MLFSIFLFFLFALSIILLYYSSTLFIHGAAKMAQYFHLPEITIGLTFVAIGTSTPEFIVSVLASLQHHHNLAFSNSLGSNIFNTSFLLGIAALILPISVKKEYVYRDGLFLWSMTGIATLLAFAFATKEATYTFFFEGVFFLASLIIYLYYLIKTSKQTILNSLDPEEWQTKPTKSLFVYVFYFTLGLSCLIGSSYLLIYSVKNIAYTFGISNWIIGLTITAFGTSAPELFSMLVCSLKKQNEMAFGMILGSNLFNLLAVFGFISTFQMKTGLTPALLPTLWLLWGVTTVTLIFMRIHWKLTRIKGFVLLSIGILYWSYSFI